MGKRMPSKWLTLIAACFGLLMLYIDLFYCQCRTAYYRA